MKDPTASWPPFFNHWHQSVLKWAVRLLVFEIRALAAITGGFVVSFVVAVPAGLLTTLILSSFELDHEYVVWATRIIQASAFAVWLLASIKVYRYLKQRSVSGWRFWRAVQIAEGSPRSPH